MTQLLLAGCPNASLTSAWGFQCVVVRHAPLVANLLRLSRTTDTQRFGAFVMNVGTHSAVLSLPLVDNPHRRFAGPALAYSSPVLVRQVHYRTHSQ